MFGTIGLAFGLMLLLTLFGVPLAFGFLVSSIVGVMLSLGSLDLAFKMFQQAALNGANDYVLVVLPFFTVMGVILARSGAAGDLFSLVNSLLRRVPARLALATIGGNAIFAAVTGVGVAAIAAFSKVAYPEMQRSGYARSFSTGCIAGSAVLGLLIPPSVFMVLWAVLTEQSVGKLFLAGVVPGLVLASLFAVYCVVHAFLSPSIAPGQSAAVSSGAVVRRDTLLGSFGIIAIIVMTLGGIWMGVLTPTEASAFGLIGSILLAWAKGTSTSTIASAFVEAGLTVTPILFLILGAHLYTRMLAFEGVPNLVQSTLAGMGLGTGGTVLFMVVVWFLLGCLIDSVSIMLLTVPIFWPVALSLGIDPIVFALVGILVIEAGVLTPPFGLALFVTRAAVPDRGVMISHIVWGALPYWIAILLTAVLVWNFPMLALWLPNAGG